MRDVGSRGEGERYQVQETGGGGGEVAYEMVDCGGTDTDGILGRRTHGGGNLAGCGSDTKI